MGQSAVDLPDPVEQNSPAPGASADDLLAQLAGDEIDRLLAGAHETPGKPSAGGAATPKKPSDGTSPHAAPEPSSQELKRAEADPAPVEEPQSAPDAEEKIDSQLEALFAELNDPEAKPKHSAASESKAGSPENKAQAVDDPPVAATDLDSTIESEASEKIAQVESEMTDAEADAPADAEKAAPEPVVEDPTQGESANLLSIQEMRSREAGERPAALLAEDVDDAPLPLVLRPLEWINAPFAELPEGVRELLGKVAIVTLFNAVAVLLYVLLFRR